MKHLLFSVALLLSATTNASAVNEAEELFDCDFAGETSKQAVINKSQGITLEEMRDLMASIPSSALKSIYAYYTELGYQFDDKQQAYQTAYQSCNNS
ncbi:MAG: hypothetical protein KZQ70_00905 [gamma proteobacterium symbiont of Lucinoma myriamae]|nr:hypothetical protein [gamma proteobacterium symbiont of Lucinoma myriamae]MCU7817926.1 hypothetical protein [gamma proteobacterium symbiont of Lucinoma myriamae]